MCWTRCPGASTSVKFAALHLQQGEEVGVLGHEPHRRLGALADVDERRVGVGIDGLRPARWRRLSRMCSASSLKRASLFSKYQ